MTSCSSEYTSSQKTKKAKKAKKKKKKKKTPKRRTKRKSKRRRSLSSSESCKRPRLARDAVHWTNALPSQVRIRKHDGIADLADFHKDLLSKCGPRARLGKEVTRSGAAKRVRLAYANLCRKKLGSREPRESFNRWLCERRLYTGHVDPLLPSVRGGSAGVVGNLPVYTAVSPSMRRELLDDLPVKLRYARNSRDLRKNVEYYMKACASMLESALFEASEQVVKNVNEGLTNVAMLRPTHEDQEVLDLLRDKVGSAIQQWLSPVVEEVCSEMAAVSLMAAESIENNVLDGQNAAVSALPRGPMVDVHVTCQGHPERSFAISAPHCDKLSMLYRSTQGPEEGSEDELLRAIATVLLRYDAMVGSGGTSGLQAAVPPLVFETLRDIAGVEMECFASPWNCFFPRYCSAFPDVDAPFGSCGSFFEFFPSEGSFQANPPFSEDVMLAMGAHIENLLSWSDSPLSFCVFLPNWADPPMEALTVLMNSRFARCGFVAEQREHTYVPGDQHMGNTDPYNAVHGTRVIFLQNEAGKDKWSIRRGDLEELRSVMANCDDRLHCECF